MDKIAVVLCTHKAYVDICENFIELFLRNWKDCSYDFWILVIGKTEQLNYENIIFYDEDCSLPTAIYKFMDSYEQYTHCISFLGDAFIVDNINSEEVELIINDIISNKINYCCLIPRVAFRFKEYHCGAYMRYITNDDIYNMCFVAFIANRAFVCNEFNNNISDLEFERKYLRSNNDFNKKDKAILRKNVFHIYAGIDAGKWNVHVLRKLKRMYPDIKWSGRERTSLYKTFMNDIGYIAQIVLSKNQRKCIKKVISKYFNKSFVTKY